LFSRSAGRFWLIISLMILLLYYLNLYFALYIIALCKAITSSFQEIFNLFKK
jgi:hypothetical protein